MRSGFSTRLDNESGSALNGCCGGWGERRRTAEDYDRALALVDNDVERRYLAAAHAHLEES